MTSTEPRVSAVDETTLGWLRRGLWVTCTGIYLTVFVGGVLSGGAELNSMARAAGFTLLAAFLGRLLLGFAAQASLPVDTGRMADQESPVVSLEEGPETTNVAQHFDDKALAA
jgi:hypothetical protein